VLFIDARKLGTMVSRKLRVLKESDIADISSSYHAWRNHEGGYADVAGFTRSAKLEEIQRHDFILTPGRYVGAEEVDEGDEPLLEKIERLTEEVLTEFQHGRELEEMLKARLEGLK